MSANKESKRASDKAYREAHKEESKAYREAHKEEKRNYDRSYREDHKEERKAWREDHKEERKVSKKVWDETNKEKLKVKHKAYREDHKEELKANRETNKDKINARGKAWRKANPEKKRAEKARRRAKKAGVVNAPIRANFLDFLIEVWDNKCAYCKNTSEKWEQDHFMPLDLKGHHAEYNLVLACPPCNRSKNAKHPQVWLEEMKISFIYPEYMLDNKRDKQTKNKR